jgi:hypothetical protein
MTPNKAATPGPLMLRPEHAARLAQFRIPPEVLESAGVRSVTHAEPDETLGFKVNVRTRPADRRTASQGAPL